MTAVIASVSYRSISVSFSLRWRIGIFIGRHDGVIVCDVVVCDVVVCDVVVCDVVVCDIVVREVCV